MSYNPFYDDLKERKAPVASASHRKCGAKSHKCSLPSDNLTPAQKRKLNGPITEWNVKKFVPYAVFKKMPKDLQQAHLDFLADEFPGLGLTTISTEVYGLSKPAFSAYIHSNGLKYPTTHGKCTPADTRVRLMRWIGRAVEEDTEGESVDEPAPVDEIVPNPDPAPEKSKFTVATMTADIAGNADDLMLYIKAMLGGRDAEVHIEIKF